MPDRRLNPIFGASITAALILLVFFVVAVVVGGPFLMGYVVVTVIGCFALSVVLLGSLRA